MITTPVINRQLKWWFVLWSVTCGLLLMHGFPAAVTGCHGQETTTLTHAPTVHHNSTVAMSLPHESLIQVGNQQSSTSSEQCFATITRHAFWQLSFAALIGLWLIIALADQRFLKRLSNETRKGRPPPTAGRALLTQLCVART